MRKRHPVTFQFLQNKSFTTKKAGSESFRKRNADSSSQRRAEKRILLTENPAADFCHIDGNNFSGIGSRKGNSTFDAAVICEMRHENGFTGQLAFRSAKELTHYALVRF